MGNSKEMKVFRDLQVAMDFKEMAKLGYIDTEFTMYGCAYWENNTRNYVVSRNEREIWSFIEDSKKIGIHTTPVKKMSKTCPVPKGQQEEIANSVKLALVDELALNYPITFWKSFEDLSQCKSSDKAVDLLSGICKDAGYSFSQEKMSIAESLLDFAYEVKAISKDTYQKLRERMKHMGKNLLEDLVAKNVLQKSFYTIMYQVGEGNYKTVTNARKEWIYNKKYQLEKEGIIVSPIYAQCYWYNNQTSLDEVRKKHDNNCANVLNDEYFNLVKRIKELGEVIEKDKFRCKYSEMVENKNDDEKEMIIYYGHKWNIV